MNKIFELFLIIAIILTMKRLSIYFLAFLTFWMSTWMVTDIHDWSVADQSHSAISAQQAHSNPDSQVATQDHNLHCGVCSYDHGGHVGQTLATPSFVAENSPTRNVINSPPYSNFWYSRDTTPNLRPPIA